MKRQIKSGFKKIFAPVASRMGYVKNSKQANVLPGKNDLLQNFYIVLQQISFTPKHIVDVGANHGTWTRETLNYFPDAYYTLLEPQRQMEDSIKDILKDNKKVKFHAAGAGKKPGTFKFTIVDRDDSCSFLYSQEEAAKMGFTQIEVPVVTLNEFLPTTNLPAPDLIKIDAEGLDLEVLSGADRYFGQTEIFMVEAGVVNKGFDNSVLKLLAFMDEHGYRLFDFTDLNRPLKLHVLWLVEMVFIKKDGVIDKAINSNIQ